ncbi:MAG: hypothetical protein ABI790_09635, partial [Betaproteobacteria bacterium]
MNASNCSAGENDCRIPATSAAIANRCSASSLRRLGLAVACVAVLFLPAIGNAALSAGDLDAQTLERMVADDPRAAVRESEAWQAEGLKNGDKAKQLRALRLMVMATAQLEE